MLSAPVSFRIASINVNGLRDVRKRRLVFNYLKKFRRTIFLLQETHCPPGNGRLWKSQWGSVMFLTEKSGNSGGVATLFSKDLDLSFSEAVPSRHHRFLVTEFTLQEEVYKIVNVYFPTSDKEKLQIDTLKELESHLDSQEDPHVFLGGDFNVALDEVLDREGYISHNIPNSLYRSELNHLLEKNDLGDIWRTQNPSLKDFTWSRTGKLARLDYLFVPHVFPGHIKASQHRTCAWSDHRMIAVVVRPCDKPKGRGFWKLKPYLLQRQDFCLEIEEAIQEGERESEGLASDLRWEFLKLKIRERSITFAKKLREEQTRLEAELETRLLVLEKEIYTSRDFQEEFNAVKRELYQIQMLKARESMVRSRVKWVGEGERPTKYFLNLEKKQFETKTISSVYNEEGTLLLESDDILKYEHSYFSRQYSINTGNREALGQGQGIPFLPRKESPLSELDRQLLNRDLSVEELEIALKDMKSGKSPGCDGLPPELYRRFWGLLGKHLLASFRHSRDQGMLSPDQRRGVIALIPKKGKDRRFVRNWRPISMLNADYKILAKVLAKRLASVIPSLIHQNQTGFIPTRFIGDNIKNTQAIIDFTQQTGRSGLVVSLDFRAAFDSLDHQFLLRALQSYQLGDYFLDWISTLYTSSESCVMNGGLSSGWFPFRRGIRQGCPISPFLFALAVEKLADAIRDSPDIGGLDLMETHTKILQFADDSTLFLDSEISLVNALSLLEDFRKVSGLELNLQKTSGLTLGDISLNNEISSQISWGRQLKILGIVFDSEDYEGKNQKLNFDPAIAKMKRVCDSWELRNLSLKGKVVVLNTLVLPIISYQCTMLPVPPTTFSQTEKLISAFIWRNKKAKIARRNLEKSTAEGGLGLHNIRSRVKTAKIAWLKKLIKPATEPWHFYLEFKMDATGEELAGQRSGRKRKFKRVAPFFAEVYDYWAELYDREPATEIAIRNELLWGNKFLRGRVKKKFEAFCQARGVNKINDLLAFGRIMTDTQFRARHGCSPLPGLLRDLAQLFPQSWLQMLSPTDFDLPSNRFYVQNEKAEWVDIQTLSAKHIYVIFETRKPEGYTCRERWMRAYNGDEAFASHNKWRSWNTLTYEISHEVQLQSWAFKIMYRIIPCGVYLCRLKIRESEICSHCAERDDMFHFFFECSPVKNFWDSLATWVEGRQGILDFPQDLMEEEFLLGVVDRQGDYSLFNYILLFAKFYIYKVKVFELGEPDLMQFLLELKSRLAVERKCCYSEASYSHRFKKWEKFYLDF